MTALLEFKSEQGATVLVETADPARSGPLTRGGRADEAIAEASKSLESMLSQLGPAVKGIVSELRASTDWPDEVEVEFAVKISADSNVIIARAGGEANFRIALRWSSEGKDG